MTDFVVLPMWKFDIIFGMDWMTQHRALIHYQKKDDNMRLCIEYKMLNQVSEKICYMLLRIDDLFDQLGEGALYVKINIRSDHYQLSI